MISIDGLPAFALDDSTLRVPTLRRLIREGAWAKRMTPVNPAVTWPNHTTMVTGDTPARHGVLYNGLLVRQDGWPPVHVEPWRDKALMVRVPTVYDLAFRAGLSTAQVDWVAIQNPGTITWAFPERPNPDGPVEREVIAAGNATQDELATFTKRSIIRRDEIWTSAAVDIIRAHKPNLLLFHLLNLDSVHHRNGPRTEAARSAIAFADSCVARVLNALDEAGLKDRTTVLVVSDHGFKAVRRNIRANAALAAQHLDKSAYVMAEGGMGLVYVLDRHKLREIERLFAAVEGISQVIPPARYKSLGLPSPGANRQMANLVLAAKDGYAFANGTSAPVVVDAPAGDGQHGYLNTDPDMDAIFIAAGYGIRAGARLDRIQNVDVAPTVAELLGVRLPHPEGHVLRAFLAK
ncbi:MAG: alkaline phosphatase family protein [Bryobacteraceae bacterium]